MNRTGLIGIALVAASLSFAGCAREDSTTQQEEIDELRLELEQLANAVGRMEFRIYELENQNASANPTPSEEPLNPTGNVPDLEEPAEDGKFDLTLME